jgi:hypothetical protein
VTAAELTARPRGAAVPEVATALREAALLLASRPLVLFVFVVLRLQLCHQRRDIDVVRHLRKLFIVFLFALDGSRPEGRARAREIALLAREAHLGGTGRLRRHERHHDDALGARVLQPVLDARRHHDGVVQAELVLGGAGSDRERALDDNIEVV